MGSPPTGTVTFLFTDIEGSTRLWEERPEEMRAALAEHDEILRGVIDAHAGYVFATGGDGFAVAFGRAGDALRAAVQVQGRLGAYAWPGGAVVRVRIGVHTGEASERGGDYFGPVVNRTARLMAVAHGGQVVCSRATAALSGGEVPMRSLGEHRLRDLAAAELVFQVGDGEFPALRSVDAVPTNLPVVRTELIGRTADVAALARLVERERLVTLTGVGGVGKTRLALAVAASLAPGFADGCWLVELSPVTDGDEVPRTVAAALRAPTTTVDALAGYLADRRVVLVLDNCEHVLDAVADVVDAIQSAAPDVHVVVTSREPLGIDGEQVRRVASLATPDADASVEVAGASAAVRLFAERAVAHESRFVLDERNVAAVVEICRHLDGIPLAIELAAARVRGMAPAEIARRLDERFRLLGAGSRRAQERHRTLFAAVSWSHDLLSEAEKVTFRRLAVFPASFDLAAAEAVAGVDDAVVDVVDCVLRLVDRSLVGYEPDTDRYRFLETLRQYGADRLAEAGETEATRARHAAYFLAFAEQKAAEILDARYQAAYPVLLAELENLRAVEDWCSEHQRWTELLGMARGLFVFLIDAAGVDAARWYRLAIARPDAFDAQTLADALGELAWITVTNLGDFSAAIAFAEESIAGSECAGLHASPWARGALTMVSNLTGRAIEDRIRDAELAIAAAAERRDDQIAVVNTLMMFGVALAPVDPVAALDSSLEAVRWARQCGQQSVIISAIVSAGAVYLIRGAEEDFASALALFETTPDMQHDTTNAMWLNLDWAHLLVRARRVGAVSRLAKAIHLADRLQSPHAEHAALGLLALCVGEAGLLAESAVLAGYCDGPLVAHRVVFLEEEFVRLDAVLQSDPDRAVHEAAGAAASRREILALVGHLASVIDDQDSRS